MRRRVPKIGEETVASEICHETVVPIDGLRAIPIQGGDRIKQLFGI